MTNGGLHWSDEVNELFDSKDKRIAELEAALRWQPIATAPKDRTRVLIAWDRETRATLNPVGAFWSEGNAWLADSGGGWRGSYGPSHWMPLPAPPKSGS